MTIHDLINFFLPIFFFHSQESYFPASFEYAFNNCQLYNGDTLIADYGQVKQPMIQNNYGHRIRINPKAYHGELTVNPYSKASQNVPIYVFVKDKPYNNYIDIVYVLYFTYNAPYQILWKSVGGHDSDLEHITVRIARNTSDLIGIYYSYHSEGVWYHPHDIEFIEKHPVVYVAKGSHGFYPRYGRHFRIFGLANDVMDKGRLWYPSKIVRVDTDKADITPPYWMSYRGQLSMEGVDNIPLKGWFRNNEVDSSSTEFRDCCCPCWKPNFCLCTVPFRSELIDD